MRNKFVSDETAIPKHASSFHSYVSFLLMILHMMFPSAHRMFRGFLDILSLCSDSTNIQSASTTIVGIMDIFSARRGPDSKALTGDSYWPSLATYSIHPLSASRGHRKPWILPYRKNLYSALAYAFVVPSSSFRHAVALYELPISCSTSCRKARIAFMTRTACLSRSPVPWLASDPPPPRDLGVCLAVSEASELGTLERLVAVATELASLRGRVGAVLPVPLLVRKCFRPLIHLNSKSSGCPLLVFSVPSPPPPSRDLLFRPLSDELSVSEEELLDDSELVVSEESLVKLDSSEESVSFRLDFLRLSCFRRFCSLVARFFALAFGFFFFSRSRCLFFFFFFD